MPTKHPAYTYARRSRVIGIHPKSVYFNTIGTVTGYVELSPTEVRVSVKWDKDEETARYRVSSIATAPFRAADNPPSITRTLTETHKIVKRVYKIPAQTMKRERQYKGRDL